jgi:hypothetical protein
VSYKFVGSIRPQKKLVAKLRDGHGFVSYEDPSEGDLPVRLDWIENQLVVTATKDDTPFRRGDVLLSVDGQSAQDLLAETESQVSGSDVLRRHRALNVIGFGPQDRTVKVVLRRDGTKLALDVKRSAPSGSLFFKNIFEFKHPPSRTSGTGSITSTRSPCPGRGSRNCCPCWPRAEESSWTSVPRESRRTTGIWWT